MLSRERLIYNLIYGNPLLGWEIDSLLVEPPSNNIAHITFSVRLDLPRGLVVRIRCSLRRGPDSIPGVGIVSFFGMLILFVERFDQLTRLCGNPDSAAISEEEKMCISLHLWIRYRLITRSKRRLLDVKGSLLIWNFCRYLDGLSSYQGVHCILYVIGSLRGHCFIFCCFTEDFSELETHGDSLETPWYSRCGCPLINYFLFSLYQFFD